VGFFEAAGAFSVEGAFVAFMPFLAGAADAFGALLGVSAGRLTSGVVTTAS
jgi:hypothetical protein